jgi:hypothetical protein
MTDLPTRIEAGEATDADRLQRLAAVLKSIRPDGRVFEPEDRGGITDALLSGLIESREQMKACKTCGTPRVDYRYWRVTEAGRLFLAALVRAAQKPAR